MATAWRNSPAAVAPNPRPRTIIRPAEPAADTMAPARLSAPPRAKLPRSDPVRAVVGRGVAFSDRLMALTPTP